jgi:hypothetical protein
MRHITSSLFGPKRGEVVGGGRKLYNMELHKLYFSRSIFRMTKSRRMKRAEHIARVRENRNVYMFLVGKAEGKNQ